MKHKRVCLSDERDVTLSAYTISEAHKPTILICPGGGYTDCEESEALPVVRALNRMGYNAFILRYSIGTQRIWPFPLEDFDMAMDHLWAHADEYGIDPQYIVAVGFSAGGHVVSAAASAAKRRPFAAILCYGLTASETLQYCAPDSPDCSTLVNKDTCPIFFASSRNDWIVPIFNTTRMIDALQENWIDYEAHIYGYALHGFSIGAEAGATGPLFCSRVGNWLKDSMEWVDELVSGRYRSIRESAAYQDEHSVVLSTKNSCKMLNAHKDALKKLKTRFPMEYLLYLGAQKKIGAFMDTVSLRNLFDLCKVNEKTIQKMDDCLSAIPIERG